MLQQAVVVFAGPKVSHLTRSVTAPPLETTMDGKGRDSPSKPCWASLCPVRTHQVPSPLLFRAEVTSPTVSRVQVMAARCL